MGQDKLNRPHIVCIRMTDAEYNLLTEKVFQDEKAISRSWWIRQRIFCGDREMNLSDIKRELKKIAVAIEYMKQRRCDDRFLAEDMRGIIDRCYSAIKIIEENISDGIEDAVDGMAGNIKSTVGD